MTSRFLFFIISMLSMLFLPSCATLTNDPTVPIAVSLSDGSKASCVFTNKRGSWKAIIPSVVTVRRSDDDLRYECNTQYPNTEQRRAVGTMRSTMGAKLIASAAFLDFGITDAITDMHREYPASFVIPIDPL